MAQPEFKVWGKNPQPQPEPVVVHQPPPQVEEPEMMPPPGYPPGMKPPSKAKIALMVGMQLVGGAVGLLLNLGKRLLGFGLIALGKTLKFITGSNSNGSKAMSLRSVFLGAALVVGGMMAPGAFYMTQPNEIVTTRVTGKVMADAKDEFPGQKYIIYTNQGRFDTYGAEGGKDIKEGCVYDFNVKSARIHVWPPGYTRSIVSFKPSGDCKP
jgi:hypothetical protein